MEHRAQWKWNVKMWDCRGNDEIALIGIERNERQRRIKRNNRLKVNFFVLVRENGKSKKTTLTIQYWNIHDAHYFYSHYRSLLHHFHYVCVSHSFPRSVTQFDWCSSFLLGCFFLFYYIFSVIFSMYFSHFYGVSFHFHTIYFPYRLVWCHSYKRNLFKQCT